MVEGLSDAVILRIVALGLRYLERDCYEVEKRLHLPLYPETVIQTAILDALFIVNREV